MFDRSRHPVIERKLIVVEMSFVDDIPQRREISDDAQEEMTKLQHVRIGNLSFNDFGRRMKLINEQ